MRCPECHGAGLRFRSADYAESHGLECGPYERFHDEWYECPACGAWFDPDELAYETPHRGGTGTLLLPSRQPSEGNSDRFGSVKVRLLPGN